MTQCLQDMAIFTIEDFTNLLIAPPDSIKNYEHSGTMNLFDRSFSFFLLKISLSRFYC